MYTSGGYPNGIRYEGSEGWIFVSRGNYVASSSDSVTQGNNVKALDANDPKILTSEIGENEIHLYRSDNQHGNWLDCIESRKELKMAVKLLVGNDIVTAHTTNESTNTVVLAFGRDRAISNLKVARKLAELGEDGYMIRTIAGKTYMLGNTDKGVLYGVFNLIRLMQTNSYIASLNIKQKPTYDVRILNHWDNLNRSVERGYAGISRSLHPVGISCSDVERDFGSRYLLSGCRFDCSAYYRRNDFSPTNYCCSRRF